jgi:hypothetical protein
VPASVISARQQWEEGRRRVEASRGDRGLHARFHHEVDLVLEELRRRIGATFSLEQLAGVYDGAEEWTRDLLEERGAAGWPARLTTVLDAAFYNYALGAIDYAP